MRYKLIPGPTYRGHGRWKRGHAPVGHYAKRQHVRLNDRLWMNNIRELRGIVVGGGFPLIFGWYKVGTRSLGRHRMIYRWISPTGGFASGWLRKRPPQEEIMAARFAR